MTIRIFNLSKTVFFYSFPLYPILPLRNASDTLFIINSAAEKRNVARF